MATIKPDLLKIKFFKEDSYTVKIYPDTAKKWRWLIKSSNGQILDSSSQGFASEQYCLKNLKLVGQKIADLTKDI